MTIGQALRQGTAILDSAGVSSPAFTAEVLLRHALHRERAWLFAHQTEELPQRAWIHYGRYLDERLKGKPTQYITGIQEFYGRTFRVNPHVLIPRPETEHLVETAIDYLAPLSSPMLLDIGTGSGAIAITIALECDVSVFACDISVDALKMAQRNAQSLAADVTFFASDLLSCVRSHSFDLILSNPPYIAEKNSATLQPEVLNWEPHTALFAGENGSDVYGRLIAEAARVLRRGGRLILELGYDSLDNVRTFLTPPWTELEVVNDLAGWARVLVAGLS